jgi:protein-tyrosine phosphatase
MTGDARIAVLFVCMGNICRSPTAAGVFAHRVAGCGAAGRFLVESAGTGDWHAGELPDSRAREVAARHGIELRSRARQVTRADFARFDHLVCMDRRNLRDLLTLGAPREKIRLLLSFDPGAPLAEVPDPYGEGSDRFEEVFALIDSACRCLIESLLAAAR